MPKSERKRLLALAATAKLTGSGEKVKIPDEWVVWHVGSPIHLVKYTKEPFLNEQKRGGGGWPKLVGKYVVVVTTSNRTLGRDDQLVYVRGFKRRKDAKSKAIQLYEEYESKQLAKTEAYWARAMVNQKKRREREEEAKRHKKSVVGKLERAREALKRALTREKRAITIRKKWARKVRYYSTIIDKKENG